jgi:diaminohydroxyphosphoribosylaminopyrimidine deaminase / 5-amino-6-(5-phosphoribosylamino)uracil reductase
MRNVLKTQDEIDRHFMAEALTLGARGLGQTWPNPSVGAVLVRGTQVIGSGHTQPGGRPHGEAMAFDEAGDAAAGATLYVTLEPCSHRTIRGGTPCMERVLLAGVRRVVSAIDDPNPRIAGLGHALLRMAGVKVTVGVGAQEALRQHRGHILRVTQGRPMVTLKIARTADNFAGGAGGTRIAISGDEAMDWVHRARASHDAIMVGIGTVLADDPQLNVRLAGLEHLSPVRVVLDSALRLPLASKLVQGARVIPVWVIAAEDAAVEPERRLVAAGVEVMRVSRNATGQLDLKEALELLAVRGITRVFSEGGPMVGEQLALAGLADEIVVSTSSARLDQLGIVAIRPGLARLLGDAAYYRPDGSQMFGQDRFATYVRIS